MIIRCKLHCYIKKTLRNTARNMKFLYIYLFTSKLRVSRSTWNDRGLGYSSSRVVSTTSPVQWHAVHSWMRVHEPN